MVVCLSIRLQLLSLLETVVLAHIVSLMLGSPGPSPLALSPQKAATQGPALSPHRDLISVSAGTASDVSHLFTSGPREPGMMIDFCDP